MKVTALRLQARNKARVNVYLDGKYGFPLAKIVAARLRIGQELDEAAIARLRGTDDEEKAYEQALKFLAPRMRSEAEVRKRLTQHKLAPALIEGVVARLTRAGLLNDKEFASHWVENRSTFRPRSARVLRAELRQKGLGEAEVSAALTGADDNEAAYALGAKRVRRYTALPRPEFRRKLSEYLARRGFGFDIIEPVVERLWSEHGSGEAGDDPGFLD
ncbi:MAG: RecX family transcriptional regulator [Anaerolineales bacterium]|nr:RecX family transcriptional regulator [Anaerolineales bacterium]